MRRRRNVVLALALIAAVCAVGAVAGTAAPAAERLTVYSGRNEVFVKPLVDRFTRQTGIGIQVRYGDSAALAATILEEGGNSPADLFFSQEAGALGAVAHDGLLTKLPPRTLRRVPQRFRSRDGVWVGTSARARVVVYDTGKLRPADLPTSIYGFTQARWKGKLGLAPTNASFQAYVTALRLVAGEDRARDWLIAMKANDAKFFPNNISILQAIARGEIVVGLANHYYLYQLKAQQPDAPVANHFLGRGDPGALVNAAGVGILKSSKKKRAAQRFVDFLLSYWAQHRIARGPGNAEYPVSSRAKPRPGLPPIADIEGPQINLGRLGRELGPTLELLNEVGYTR
jgi:iron(III) transport system substrate-binding protein